MDANGRELVLKDEVYAAVPCSIEILNGTGHGLREEPYVTALFVQSAHRGIPFSRQPRFPVHSRDSVAGEFIPDPIAYGRIIVDAKAIISSPTTNAAR